MYVLGIDIGTTSVKVVLVQKPPGKEICSASFRHNADIAGLDKGFHEQDASLICSTLGKCIKSVGDRMGHSIIGKVETISICGQMHGCILWTPQPVPQSVFYPNSNLITWRDQRCTSGFLESLPLPEKSVAVSTGFGCATLFWLQRYEDDRIKRYTCAGTIMDYIVVGLCKLIGPIMSTQNAMSWGYYNFCEEVWNVRILESSGFPTKFLPPVVKPGRIVGSLKYDWWGLKAGADVLVGLGDMQCAVMSCNPGIDTAVFSLGTSAQLSMTSTLAKGKSYYQSKRFGVSYANSAKSRICVPYFNENCLWTSASLNGGVVFENFAKELYDWTKKFLPSVTMEQIYSQLQDSNPDRESSSCTKVRIKPTVFGERHAPLERASVSNIDENNCKIPKIARELAHSIVANVFDMFQRGGTSCDIQPMKEVQGCGTAFIENKLFRHALQRVSKVKCDFSKDVDAAFGAAMVDGRM